MLQPLGNDPSALLGVSAKFLNSAAMSQCRLPPTRQQRNTTSKGAALIQPPDAFSGASNTRAHTLQPSRPRRTRTLDDATAAPLMLCREMRSQAAEAATMVIALPAPVTASRTAPAERGIRVVESMIELVLCWSIADRSSQGGGGQM